MSDRPTHPRGGYGRGGGRGGRGGHHHNNHHGHNNSNSQHHHSSSGHRGGRGGGRGGAGGGSGGGAGSGEKPRKENILDLQKYMDKRITVKFNGGREVNGMLKGFDALMNLVLDDVQEVTRGMHSCAFFSPLYVVGLQHKKSKKKRRKALGRSSRMGGWAC
jgi:U6 snRNA-associated Sm-like protein LSm7